MEVVEIGLDDLDSGHSSKPSVNFGDGIELLMNDKKRSSTMNLNLGELDSLENELNEISGNQPSSSTSSGGTKTLSGLAGSFFNLGGFGSSENAASSGPSINVEEVPNDSNLGQATRESAGTTKTWDGFTKMNEIPVSSNISSAKMTDREKRRKKRIMIKKLEEWNDKGLVKNFSHFSMDSPYEEVEDEYETALEDKRRKDSVKLQGWWFMTFINSLEYANAVFNPFDLNLDGWGEQVSEDLDSYEEIFGELYEKYKGGKMAPEVSLLLRVGFSAAVLNFSNKALSSATPAFNDVIKQSPELMKMFTNATVSSMSQASPGFAMANNLMQEQMNRPRGPPPPAPVETKNQPPPQRPGNMVFTESQPNRPDIQAGRGAMFREQGVEMNGGFGRVNEPTTTQSQFPIFAEPPQPTSQAHARPEMRGPQTSDIDNILSGLKTRSVNMQESSTPPSPPAQQMSQAINMEDDSMISISSLKDLQNTNMPRRANRRRNNSSRNTISLDI